MPIPNLHLFRLKRRSCGTAALKSQRALWFGEKNDARASTGLSGAVWIQRHLPTSRQSLRPEGQFRFGDFTRYPTLIRKCVEAKENNDEQIILWGDGSPTREFLYVEDAAEGIVLATERYDGSEPVNLGTGEEISIRDLAPMIAGEVGFSGSIVWDTTKPNGQPRRCLDVGRAQQYFGFRAQCGLREGIAKTVK